MTSTATQQLGKRGAAEFPAVRRRLRVRNRAGDVPPEDGDVEIVGVADVGRDVDVEAREVGLGVEEVEQVAPATLDVPAVARPRLATTLSCRSLMSVSTLVKCDI